MFRNSRGGFVDSDDKQLELLRRFKTACGFDPKNFDNPKEITAGKFRKINETACAKEKVIKELDKLLDQDGEFYEYLCYSNLDKCLKKKFGADMENYTIIDSDKNVVRSPIVPEDPAKTFILTKDGTVEEYLGDVVPVIDIYRDILTFDGYTEEIIYKNELIEIYNDVFKYSYDIEMTLDAVYERPYPLDASKYKLGPTYWNFYKDLFHKIGSGYLVNKSADNPIFQLVLSGQLGIFMKLFDDVDSIWSQYPKYFRKYSGILFGNENYYQIWDKLVQISTSSNPNLDKYLSVLQKEYVDETDFDKIPRKKTTGYTSDDDIDDIESPLDVLLSFFTHFYESVKEKLVDENLVYLHNSGFFINFIDRYTKSDPSLKFMYVYGKFKQIITYIDRKKEFVKEYLVVQYVWILISMYTGNIYHVPNRYRQKDTLQQNAHIFLYLQKVLQESTTFRKIPLTKLYKNIFGEEIQFDTHSRNVSNNFQALAYCSLNIPDHRVKTSSVCTEAVIFNIILYWVRDSNNPNMIDVKKIDQIPDASDFHKKIKDLLKRMSSSNSYRKKFVPEFSKLLQNIDELNDFYKYQNVKDEFYILIARMENIMSIIVYIYYGELFPDFTDKFKELCIKNGDTCSMNDRYIYIGDNIEIFFEPGHTEFYVKNRSHNKGSLAPLTDLGPSHPYDNLRRLPSNRILSIYDKLQISTKVGVTRNQKESRKDMKDLLNNHEKNLKKVIIIFGEDIAKHYYLWLAEQIYTNLELFTEDIDNDGENILTIFRTAMDLLDKFQDQRIRYKKFIPGFSVIVYLFGSCDDVIEFVDNHVCNLHTIFGQIYVLFNLKQIHKKYLQKFVLNIGITISYYRYKNEEMYEHIMYREMVVFAQDITVIDLLYRERKLDETVDGVRKYDSSAILLLFLFVDPTLFFHNVTTHIIHKHRDLRFDYFKDMKIKTKKEFEKTAPDNSTYNRKEQMTISTENITIALSKLINDYFSESKKYNELGEKILKHLISYLPAIQELLSILGRHPDDIINEEEVEIYSPTVYYTLKLIGLKNIKLMSEQHGGKSVNYKHKYLKYKSRYLTLQNGIHN